MNVFLKIFLRSKNFNSSHENKTANQTKPKFPSAPFFELTQRKVRKIKKFKKGHKCIPKIFFEVKKFNSSHENQNG